MGFIVWFLHNHERETCQSQAVRNLHKYNPSKGERNLIGPKIRAIRLQSNPRVSQEDLAARLAARGIYFDRSALSRMEAGLRFIRDYEIAAIANALKVPVGSLFEA